MAGRSAHGDVGPPAVVPPGMAAPASGERHTRYITCPLCEASCGLEITLRSATTSSTTPTDTTTVESIRGHAADPLSRGHICPKGVALQDFHADPDRLRRPVRKVGDGWVELSWREAIALVARRLVEVQQTHGRDAVAVYLGNPNVHSLGAMTHGLEITRTLRSRNVYSATSVDQLPHHIVAWLLFGHQFLLPVPDIDRTHLLVLVGTNPMASNGSLMTVPDFPGRVRALHARGGRLVVLDPRRTETAAVADEHLPVRPGSDAYLLLALVREVLAGGAARPAPYVDGVDDVREAVAPFTLELAESVSGIAAERIRSLAHELTSGRAVVHARMGASTQEFGLVAQWATQVLNILTGALDHPGGAMFTDPAVDLVGRGILSRGSRGRWRSRVRGRPEFGGELPVACLAEEIETEGEGQVRALVCIGGNPVSSTPDGRRLDRLLPGLDLMVAIDPHITETSRHADVILPPTGPLERDHYDLIFHVLAVRNTARWSPAVIDPGPGARHDWQIARDLVAALHRARGDRPDPAQWARLRVSPRLAVDALLRTGRHHLSVRRLERAPGGVDLGPLTPCLPARLRTDDRRIRLAQHLVVDDLARVLSRAPGLAADDRLRLVGRRHQRDVNSWSHNLPRLTKGRARHHLLIHPRDAAARGIVDGSTVRVTSVVGSVEVDCRVTDEVATGVVSLPHGYGQARPGVRLRHAVTLPGVSLNDLTDPACLDEAAGTAVLNGTPVEVEPAG